MDLRVVAAVALCLFFISLAAYLAWSDARERDAANRQIANMRRGAPGLSRDRRRLS